MTIGIGLGLMEFPFSGASEFWEWVDLCEDGGVDSLWQTDRLISERPMLECMSTMAALAGATKRIKFGMNVIAVATREPVLLARQCATIDMLSDGRLLPAFGIGTVRSPDWRGTGMDTAGRGRRTDEALDLISRLWKGERVTHQGEFFHLENALISPLPVQNKLPLWIGGSSDAAMRRTARIGTGWLGGRETPDEARRAVAGIKAACEQTGRRIDDDHFGASFFFRFGSWSDAAVETQVQHAAERFPERDPRGSFAVGDARDILARINAYVDAGVSKFVLRPVGHDEEILSQTRRLIDELLPEVDALNR